MKNKNNLKCLVCGKSGKKIKHLIYSKKNSVTNYNDDFFYDIRYCEKCLLFYNSKFNNKKINYNQNSKFVTFYNHYYFKKVYQKLINKILSLVGKREVSILEFGCGDGEFFNFLLKSNLFNIKKKIAYDIDVSIKKKNKFITNNINLFKNSFVNNGINIVICRHTLEHLNDLNLFFKNITKNKNIIILLEVPNGFRSINNEFRFEDLVYEHVSYFSQNSLTEILNLNKFKIIDQFSLLNEENIVSIGFKGSPKILNEIIKNKIQNLNLEKKKYDTKIKKLLITLDNKRSAFWGVSGRCLSILNELVDLYDQGQLNCQLVDSDKRKVGKNISGFKNKIISPKTLNKKKISKIIIGTKVGYDSILREIKKLKSKADVKLWSDLV